MGAEREQRGKTAKDGGTVASVARGGELERAPSQEAAAGLAVQRVRQSLPGGADAGALQRTIGNRAVQRLLAPPVQRREEVPPEYDAPPDAVHAAARAGVQTASTTLPYAAQIQRSFGAHDIDAVRAHQGPAAAGAAAAMGAAAYTTGDHVVFAGTPDLRTTAHEAAHAVQQRAGVAVANGVGRAGDAYERHADAVADRVIAGQSAEDLLSGLA